MVEELLERFSAVVSDVCACLMGFKVRLEHFLREKLIWDLNRLKGKNIFGFLHVTLPINI